MSKRTKQDYLDMLENTVNYYSEDTSRRATNPDSGIGCVYSKEDGKNCAVGRWINYDNFDLQSYNEACSITDLLQIDDGEDFIYTDEELFVPKAQGFHYQFWADLQDFHDGDKSWDEAGLTSEGQAKIDRIKERLELGYYGNF